MSELERVKDKITETEAKVAQAEANIKKAEDAGRSETILIGLLNTLASLQNNLAELWHKENLLVTTGSGNAIIA
jgi:prefoldin subunit 5